ncbi:MAG: C25 family cysteine peptidase [bacterium]
MRHEESGVASWGIVIVLVVAIPLNISWGKDSSREFELGYDSIERQEGRVLIALPNCEEILFEATSDGTPLEVKIIQTAYIRDQKIAILQIGDGLEPGNPIELKVKAHGLRENWSKDTGPLNQLIKSIALGYNPPRTSDLLAATPGTVSRCQSLSQCVGARADILLIAAHQLFPSTYVDSLASLWAHKMGLNVAIIDVASISSYSPVEIGNFIKALYNSASAENFGDGHLGFVVLLGDAYEDDNLTPIVPEYDGYGTDMEAADHYYACISGDDEFEDVMIGRIPVGNQSELVNYYSKLLSYYPLPEEPWIRSILFTAGCYFASNQDYIVYFDSLEHYIPEPYRASRYYRYDYPQTDEGDVEATQAFIDSLALGRLLVLYAGDGDIFDWGSRYKRVIQSSYIPNLNNSGRLPIVLSMSCSNGWFDNISTAYLDGGYDCFAERLLTTPNVGAVACLASSRPTTGGAITDFSPELIKAVFLNKSTFLGEAVLAAKTRYLARLGNVKFVRQFNLLGDPCLSLVPNDLLMVKPDILIRPYTVYFTPEYPRHGSPLTLECEIWNASAESIDEVEIGVFVDEPSPSSEIARILLSDLCGWEKRKASFTLEGLPVGNNPISIVCDPSDIIDEIDETNNTVIRNIYIYPCEEGYPVKLAGVSTGIAIADLDSDGYLDILVTSDGTFAQALTLDGNTMWLRNDLGYANWFSGIEPAVFDLNGDGSAEVIVTTRSAIMALDGSTGQTIWKRYTDYALLTPLISDLDGDGSFEVILATFSFTYSTVSVYSAGGSRIASFGLTQYREKITSLVTMDTDYDGAYEILFTTDKGKITCLRLVGSQLEVVWQQSLGSSISTAVAGDLNRNGNLQVVFCQGDTLRILTSSDGSQVGGDMICPAPVKSLSLGDIDGDRSLEIVGISPGGTLFVITNGVVSFVDSLSGTPIGEASIADLNNDGKAEIVVVDADGLVHIVAPMGEDLIPPVPAKGGYTSVATVSNVDQDRSIEIAVSSSDSLLLVLDLGIDGSNIEWSGRRCQSTRMGLYAQPLFGTIDSDLHLAGRMDLVGDVIVQEDANVVLNRSAHLRMIHDIAYPEGNSPGRCEIIVNGSLSAAGTLAWPVLIEPVTVPMAKDDWTGIIVNETGSLWLTRCSLRGAITGIDCKTSNVNVSECTLTNCIVGIKTNGYAPRIDSNLITNCDYGISVNGGAPIITANKLMSNFYVGANLSSGATAVLSRNIFKGTQCGHGLASYSSSPVILPGNRFENNSMSGIYLSRSSPQIDSCWIGYNGEAGIKAIYYSNPIVSKTSIVGNNMGIEVYLYSRPVLGDTLNQLGGLNDIRLNTRYAIYNATPYPVMAQANWWGTSDPTPELFYGNIDFSGWLTVSPAGIEANSIKKQFAVFPNPFRSCLYLVGMDLDEKREVEISIFDIMGRLVRSQKTAQPSKVSQVWDGKDWFGNPVSPGVYFITIRIEKETITQKVILLR